MSTSYFKNLGLRLASILCLFIGLAGMIPIIASEYGRYTLNQEGVEVTGTLTEIKPITAQILDSPPSESSHQETAHENIAPPINTHQPPDPSLKYGPKAGKITYKVNQVTYHTIRDRLSPSDTIGTTFKLKVDPNYPTQVLFHDQSFPWMFLLISLTWLTLWSLFAWILLKKTHPLQKSQNLIPRN